MSEQPNICVLKLASIYAEYAEALGVTVAELEPEQKQIALFNHLCASEVLDEQKENS